MWCERAYGFESQSGVRQKHPCAESHCEVTRVWGERNCECRAPKLQPRVRPCVQRAGVDDKQGVMIMMMKVVVMINNFE